MIVLSPPVGLPRTNEEREQFLEKTEAFGSTTVSASTRPDWTDEDVEGVHRRFLDDNGIRVGEFSAFHYGFDHEEAAERDAAQEHYARLLRHGNMLDAHCVGFSTYGDRGKPGMWTEATWERCLDSVARLAEQAERAPAWTWPRIPTPWRPSARWSGTAKCWTASALPGSRC